MQNYESFGTLLMMKNEFLNALRINDISTAKIKLEDMKKLYKEITGKEMQTMFSEAEWNTVKLALGEDDINKELPEER